MAFAQQHRRPTQRLSVTQREYDNNNDSAALHDDTLLSPRRPSSDSDNDWHVISSAIPPTSSSSSLQRRESASPASDPSEPESFSSFRHSDDIEWLSDFDTQSSSARDDEFIANLPTHDGTGLFGEQYSDTSPLSPDESDSPTSFARAVQRISDDRQRSAERTWRAQAIDFEPDSPSKPNILLPYGGINAPSFANKSRHTRSDDNSNNNDSDDSSQVSLPSFVPTVPGFTTSDMSADKDSRRDSDAQTSEVSSTPDTKSNVKFTRRRRRNLDSIPSHHPSILGTTRSAALLSAIWDHIRRLTSDLLDNDVNTAETFGNLVTEAAFEGCLPFGSHLHMEFGNTILAAHARSPRIEGNIHSL